MQKQNLTNGDAPAWAKRLEELKDKEVELLQRDFEVRMSFKQVIESLRDDFAKTCNLALDVDDLKIMLIGIDKKLDVVIAWIAADQRGDTKRLKELREKIDDLAFQEKRKIETIPPVASLPPAQLRQELTARLDLEKLRTLCFDLGIEYDSLRGEGLEAKIRELVKQEERRGRVGRLRSWLEKQKAPD